MFQVYLVGLEAAKTYQETSKKLEERTQEEVTANVSEAYYGSVVNNARVDMLLALVAQLEKIEKDIKAYVSVGMMESIEQDKISVNLNNVKVELEKLYNIQKVLDKSQELRKVVSETNAVNSKTTSDWSNSYNKLVSELTRALSRLENNSIDFTDLIGYDENVFKKLKDDLKKLWKNDIPTTIPI